MVNLPNINVISKTYNIYQLNEYQSYNNVHVYLSFRENICLYNYWYTSSYYNISEFGKESKDIILCAKRLIEIQHFKL